MILQSGGSTAVMNRSLAGIVSEAQGERRIDKIYGARRGIESLIHDGNEYLSDLTQITDSSLSLIARTPGAALGSTRKRASVNDVEAALGSLKRLGVRWCFLIGGNDTAQTGHSLALSAAKHGLDLAVLQVPKTIDNDLAGTDHCPGYGSAARFVALATMGAGRDAETMGDASPITFIEVMGRDAGWLAAASVLGKLKDQDAPHVLGLPETRIDDERFTSLIIDAYEKYGFAVAVISENARGINGVLGEDLVPKMTDPFGHKYFASPAIHLASLTEMALRVRVRVEKPGTIQRSFTACVSNVDAKEAEDAGRAAVRYAIKGHTDKMVNLQRVGNLRYKCEFRLTPLSDVAGAVRILPPEMLDPDRYSVTDCFTNYAKPLIGTALPRFSRIT